MECNLRLFPISSCSDCWILRNCLCMELFTSQLYRPNASAADYTVHIKYYELLLLILHAPSKLSCLYSALGIVVMGYMTTKRYITVYVLTTQ